MRQRSIRLRARLNGLPVSGPLFETGWSFSLIAFVLLENRSMLNQVLSRVAAVYIAGWVILAIGMTVIAN